MEEAIRLCEQSKTSVIDADKIISMRNEIDKITPDMDDFGEWLRLLCIKCMLRRI